jgi:ABC-type transporter Mla MlaB component
VALALGGGATKSFSAVRSSTHNPQSQRLALTRPFNFMQRHGVRKGNDYPITTEKSPMLKITRLNGQDSIQTFKLEGKLLEPWVSEVLRVCAARDGQAGAPCLDLSGLLFVDQAGVRLLKELIRSGTTVSACSGFVAELLHLEKP